MHALRQRLPDFLVLTRLNRPIGSLLLVWPTLWALWIAAEGSPSPHLVVIFVLGTFLTRSAGCVINDYADRNFDGHVARTAHRPLATGAISEKEAIGVCVGLTLLALLLVLMTNTLTVMLSVGGVVLAATYPFMKRHTHLPQVVLGMAFSWGIPMAFAAQTNQLPPELWLIYIGNLLWTVVYDTYYAMVDRDDDLKIGIKSTAILFGQDDKLIIGILQVFTLLTLMMVGQRFELGLYYYLSLLVAGALFIYQQKLIRYRKRDDCFKAFMNSNWVGVVIFAGVALHYALG